MIFLFLFLFPTAQTLQRDNVEDDLDAEMPLVSPPTTPPNPTQLQHENGSSLGKFIIKANLIRNLDSNHLPFEDINSQKIDRGWHFLVFLGSFENDTPVVKEPLLECLNPKSPSETYLLLYLGIHFDQFIYSLLLLQIFL